MAKYGWRSRPCGALSLCVLLVAGFCGAVPVEPTALEQYALELINRARANPEAEAQACGIDLNEGLQPDTISYAPKQPLAFHLCLVDASRGHSVWEIESGVYDFLGEGGLTPIDRVLASGYNFTGHRALGTNPGCAAAPLGGADWTALAAEVHRAEFRMGCTRETILGPAYCEVGVGIGAGPFEFTEDDWVDAIMVTADFLDAPRTGHLLTGVAYDDTLVLEDGFYTPGEGLGCVTVTAVREGDGARFTTNTWTSGGYSLPIPPGTYEVTAAGRGFGTVTVHGLVMSDSNVKQDFAPPLQTVPVPSVEMTREWDGHATNTIIEISLLSGDLEGQSADWWVLAQAPGGLYFWNPQSGAWSKAYRPSYQEPVRDLPAQVVLRAPRLPPGKYTFYFAIDTAMNGKLDRQAILYDSVSFAVSR